MGTRSIRWCCAALLWAVSATAAAPSLPTSFLVKDINTTPVIYSGNPRQFAVVGSRLYFVAETPQGSGLWVTDGTTAGTVLLRTMPIVGTLTGVGERLFFVGEEPDSGAELWTSDGTSAGTVLVRDIRPGPDYALSSDEARKYLAAVGDVLFFSADDGEHGPQLWRSDGTSDGTSSVAEVGAGEMIAAGDVLLFVGHDAQHGSELWRSDGTTEGTQLVRDINDGPAGSEILELTALGATIFFRADDGVHGAELWTSDATAPGTHLVKDIIPGDGSSFPGQFVAVGSELFFQAGDGSDPGHLWRTDGSAAGTVPVYATGPSFGRRVALGGQVLFERQDDMHGSELWASDGTADGTALVKDINPGLANSYPAFLTTVDDLVFFTADDGIHGAELWRTDGTAAGTMLVRDINPGAAASASTYSDILANLNGALIFAADDGSHGLELWRSNGTSAGTVLLRDVWPGPATQSASPKSLTALDGLLYFAAEERGGLSSLWRSDGTEAGTQRIGDVFDINPRMPYERDEPLAVLDRRLVFAASGGQPGNELWSSDGTSAGTAMLKDIWPGPDHSTPREFTRIGDAIFFSADDGTHGRELWRTDGTTEGTVLVRDIVSGPAPSSPVQLTAVHGRLFFTFGAQSSTQLWVSDGTAQGTMHLKDLFIASNLTAVGDMLYFNTATTLWRSDGTVEGTVRLGDFHPVSGEYQPNQLTAVGEDLFFAAELSTTVYLIVVGPQHSGQLRELDKYSPSGLTAAAGQLFFAADDDEHGRELWRSDGTVEGTRLVLDINPGAAGSNPVLLSADGQRLLFYACGGESCLLWESDGTASGTHPLAHLDPAGYPFVVSGGLGYFPAYDFTFGDELRAVALSPPQCLGDCDGDRAVTIVELVRMVGIALGKLDADTCSSASVSIDQLVTAVRNALLGC